MPDGFEGRSVLSEAKGRTNGKCSGVKCERGSARASRGRLRWEGGPAATLGHHRPKGRVGRSKDSGRMSHPQLERFSRQPATVGTCSLHLPSGHEGSLPAGPGQPSPPGSSPPGRHGPVTAGGTSAPRGILVLFTRASLHCQSRRILRKGNRVKEKDRD